MNHCVDIRSILSIPSLRRELMISSIIAIQAREGVETTYEQAEQAYDKIRGETKKLEAL